MSGLDDFMNNLGFGTSKASKAGSEDVSAAQGAYNGLSAPTFNPVTPQTVGNAYSGVSTNPANNQVQTAQMSALGNLAANGGRNAASDANLAQVQGQVNSNAAGQRGAIMQNQASKGMGGAGSTLAAQLSAQQGDQNSQSSQDMQEKGQEANTALQAGQGAAAIGSNMENQQFGEGAAKAQAQNSINEFNSGMNMQGQQANNQNTQQGFGDQMGIAQGKAGVSMGAAGYQNQQAAIGAQQAGGLLGGATKLGAAAMMATGGRIPGMPSVQGDSSLNDNVPIVASPGEVVVPRTIAKSGDSDLISKFVQNPPKIGSPGFGNPSPNPNKNKESMLAALKHLGRK